MAGSEDEGWITAVVFTDGWTPATQTEQPQNVLAELGLEPGEEETVRETAELTFEGHYASLSKVTSPSSLTDEVWPTSARVRCASLAAVVEVTSGHLLSDSNEHVFEGQEGDTLIAGLCGAFNGQ